MREIDAGAFARWAFNALLAIFVLIAGFYVSPWLGGTSFYLAIILWVLVIVGTLYAAEAIPWISHLGAAERFFRSYAPPLTEDEKNQLRLRAEQREQLAWEQASRDSEEIAREQLARTFFAGPSKGPVDPKPTQREPSNSTDQAPNPSASSPGRSKPHD